MQLNKVQSAFRDLMLDHPDALNAPDAELAAQFDEYGIALPEHLKIYRNNIVNSVTDALADKLPTIENLVGREFLEAMCRSFALKHPPQHGCLNSYGAGLPDFIKSFKPSESLPYLPDMAALELAMNTAYYAADDTALRAEALQTIAPEELPATHLNLRANIQIIRSDHPLLAIKEFCEGDQTGEVDMNAQGTPIMVSRPTFSVQLVPLALDECAMLEQLAAGKALGEAAEHILTLHPEFDFSAFLFKHISLETFLAFNANTSSGQQI